MPRSWARSIASSQSSSNTRAVPFRSGSRRYRRRSFQGRGLRFHFCIPDDEHVGDFLHLCAADAFTERIVGGKLDADTNSAELFSNLLRIRNVFLRDGKDLRLYRREPERKGTARVFDED